MLWGLHAVKNDMSTSVDCDEVTALPEAAQLHVLPVLAHHKLPAGQKTKALDTFDHTTNFTPHASYPHHGDYLHLAPSKISK